MITVLVDCGKFIVQLLTKYKADSIERKKELSEVLFQISHLLYSVAGELKNDRYPTGSCAAMQHLSDGLLQKLDDPSCAELCDMLKQASNMEMLYSIKDQEVIDMVEKTAGRFYSAALLAKL